MQAVRARAGPVRVSQATSSLESSRLCLGTDGIASRGAASQGQACSFLVAGDRADRKGFTWLSSKPGCQLYLGEISNMYHIAQLMPNCCMGSGVFQPAARLL